MSFRETAIMAARTSGALLKKRFREALRPEFKARRDLVTPADIESETNIVAMLREHFPNHSILGEELPAHRSDSPYTWFVDPLDATTNFVAGIHLFAVSIALLYQGEAILAVVYDPFSDELFCAEKGHGAWLNGQGIHVSNKSLLEDCVVSYARSYHPTEQIVRTGLRIYEKLLLNVRAMRQFGTCSLDFCYVAAGRTDAALTPLTDELRLEYPAGCLLVEEAGGRQSDFSGRPWGLTSQDLLVSNGIVHDELLRLLAEATDDAVN